MKDGVEKYRLKGDGDKKKSICYWPKFPTLLKDLDFSSFVSLKFILILIVGWDGGGGCSGGGGWGKGGSQLSPPLYFI